jgi:4-alpha-glucanotransferase
MPDTAGSVFDLDRRGCGILLHPTSLPGPHVGAIRALLASSANVVILPMQDVLGLGDRARMNVPGTIHGNWRWRLTRTRLGATARVLRDLVETFGRPPGVAAR